MEVAGCRAAGLEALLVPLERFSDPLTDVLR